MAWGKITARLLVFLRSSTCVADDWEPRTELRPVERWPSGRRQRFAKPYSARRRNPLKRRETPCQAWGNGAVVVTRSYSENPYIIRLFHYVIHYVFLILRLS